ncbi:TPA: DUF3987 domain-containing protein [Providencia alcalifaciens]|nr:DUF3987 domain-containing protein [Providencia alcalifaciens]
MSQQHEELCLKIEKLPNYCQEMIGLIHARTGAAAEIILPTMLSVMSLACQDSFDVEPINGLKYPLSLYSIVLARSGCRKTTVYKLLTKAISQLEQQLEDEFYREKEIFDQSLVLWNCTFSVLDKSYKKALSQGINIDETLLDLKKCLSQKPVEPVKKRLIINDSTSEALSKELGLGYPVLNLMSDEAGELLESNLFRKTPLLNSLWCADGKAVSRASSDCYVVRDFRFGMLLMLQPALFDDFLARRGKKVQGSGFLARSLLVDLEKIKHFCKVTSSSQSSESSLDDFSSTLISHLLNGIKRRENNEARPCITFDHDAKDEWNTYHEKILMMMKQGGELYPYDDYTSRFMEHSSRIAAVMQMFVTPDSTVVSKETLESAVYVTQWFLNHFIKKIDNFKELSDTEKLLTWLKNHLSSNKSFDFKRNHIIKNGPSSLRSSERLMPALEKLQDEGLVQLFESSGTNYVKLISSDVTFSKGKNSLGNSISRLPVIK